MKGRENHIPDLSLHDDLGLAVFGHELGNVLNGLLGMAELLSDSELGTEQQQWMDAILESARQLDRLLECARRRTDGAPLRERPPARRVDGLAMLENTLLGHAPSAHARDNLLALVVDPGLARFWHCDPCRIRQLLDNLLSNAVKFTRGGEVVLEAAAGPRGRDRRAALILVVRDTGPGLGSARRPLFKGLRAHGVRESGGTEGSGLGLLVCRRIVRSMSGSLNCSSPSPGGTRFRIDLPDVLRPGGGRPLARRTCLLSALHCELDLEGTLLESVGRFLERLAVSWQPRPLEHASDSAAVAVRISARAGHSGGRQPQALVLTAPASGQRSPQRRVLSLPVLQPVLAAALLAIVMAGRRDDPMSAEQTP